MLRQDETTSALVIVSELPSEYPITKESLADTPSLFGFSDFTVPFHRVDRPVVSFSNVCQKTLRTKEFESVSCEY